MCSSLTLSPTQQRSSAAAPTQRSLEPSHRPSPQPSPSPSPGPCIRKWLWEALEPTCPLCKAPALRPAQSGAEGRDGQQQLASNSRQGHLAQGPAALSTAPTRAHPRPPAPSPRPAAAGVQPSPAAAVVTWSRGRVAHVAHDALELTEAGMGGVRGVRGAGGADGVRGTGGVGDGHVVASAPARAPATSPTGEAPLSVEPTAPRRSPGAIFGGFMGRMTARGAEPTAQP